MSLTQEIDDTYVKYCLLGHNTKELCSHYTHKSRAVLKRYISLKEDLSPELYPLLNSRKQLTQSFAQAICKTIKNPLQQVSVYHSIDGKNTSEKIQNMSSYTNCLICCANSSYHEHMDCCGQCICTRCFKQCLIQSVTGLTMMSLTCPFCRSDIPTRMICDFTRSHRIKINNHTNYYSLEPWRNTPDWLFSVFSDESRIHPYQMNYYLRNLHDLYEKYTKFISDDPECIENNHIGYCHQCIQSEYQTIDNFKRLLRTKPLKRSNLERINLAKVQKDCANDEQLKSEIFQCQRCSEADTCVKRCPHCGTKTIRPDGCNYVRCVCGNHWCFVCNMRLPDSHEGHNVHYWIGLGSSAYDDRCRISEDHHGIDYVIDGCSCEYCSTRDGAPICASLDCNRPVPKKSYTSPHGRSFQWGIYCEQHC